MKFKVGDLVVLKNHPTHWRVSMYKTWYINPGNVYEIKQILSDRTVSVKNDHNDEIILINQDIEFATKLAKALA